MRQMDEIAPRIFISKLDYMLRMNQRKGTGLRPDHFSQG